MFFLETTTTLNRQSIDKKPTNILKPGLSQFPIVRGEGQFSKPILKASALHNWENATVGKTRLHQGSNLQLLISLKVPP